jgi:hypothetical protein
MPKEAAPRGGCLTNVTGLSYVTRISQRIDRNTFRCDAGLIVKNFRQANANLSGELIF